MTGSDRQTKVGEWEKQQRNARPSAQTCHRGGKWRYLMLTTSVVEVKVRAAAVQPWPQSTFGPTCLYYVTM